MIEETRFEGLNMRAYLSSILNWAYKYYSVAILVSLARLTRADPEWTWLTKRINNNMHFVYTLRV